MRLEFNATFEGLYSRDGLIALDEAFVRELFLHDIALHNRLVTGRAAPEALAEKEHAQLIIDLGAHLEDFIAELFTIRAEVTALKARHFELAPLYSCKRLFVQRRAAKSVSSEQASALNGHTLSEKLAPLLTDHRPLATDHSFELLFATHVMHWLDKPELHAEALHLATQYAAWAVHTRQGQEKHAGGILFKVPRKLEPMHLVALETEIRDGVTVLKIPHHHRRNREGFGLTDDGGTLAKALDEANYCIWCHNQGKDSCSKGMKEKEGGFKRNSLGITLAGCPLEERISEMNFLKSEGIPIGALAAIVIDNPMCAGTGHRICNDCMKSCIYQKQEPVNIPQTETRTLRDVLELPYGFEIYSLLTRWNPLNLHRPIPRAETGSNVLVAGLGPAGYTLAHHLLNDGHTVVGIDGLKIEPLPQEISGVTPLGEPVPFTPVKDIAALFEKLDERPLAGFGGVAEYGITVRWDKNFLKIIRLLLERRRNFTMIGGVRMGGTVTIASAWEMGFDHIALCMGAGKPTVIDMENGLARGVRAASDFLMALQLTGAAKADSIANLQLRLPVVVIGGGLTAIDTATESMAYYPVQVEKFLSRYEALCTRKGEESVRAGWSEEEQEIAQEFITHARAIREERTKAHPDIGRLLDGWGGVKMIYRRRLIDAPSYRLNHEEVEKALEEGIAIAEGLEPAGVDIDAFGHARAIRFHGPDGDVTLPARAILIAAGTSPNTVLAREDPEHVMLQGKYFRAVDEAGAPVTPEPVAKPRAPQVLMSFEPDGRAISFFGDLHPSFAGNVVKAMGSAKQGYPVVTRMLARRSQALPFLSGGGLGGGPLRFREIDSQIKDNARMLRKNMTEAEKKLWHYLSQHQLEGMHFRRQHPVGNYIADFVCVKRKLIIELDGGQHATQQNYDTNRTHFLEQQGYRVLRFWNNEVLENIEGVYTRIAEALNAKTPTQPSPWKKGKGFLTYIHAQLCATVHEINRLTPEIVEVVVKAPQAARMFEPGQFYRLQNYEANALRLPKYPGEGRDLMPSTTLAMEGLAMTGARADKQNGLLSMIVLEMGGSSDLCAHLKPGEPVILMGPTGTATEIPSDETLLLAGGGLGNAVLFSIGRTARERSGNVLYFAGYRKTEDRYKEQEIEAAADLVVWCCDEAPDFAPNRPQDKVFHGNMVQAMLAYAQGALGDAPIRLQDVDRILAIGSQGMMAAVQRARHGALKPWLKPGHKGLASINSPMQCMMKEICAQCLQQHIDPETGAVSYVYTCFNQDQEMDTVSFPFLRQRLAQNSLQEKLSAQWIDFCLNALGKRKQHFKENS